MQIAVSLGPQRRPHSTSVHTRYCLPLSTPPNQQTPRNHCASYAIPSRWERHRDLSWRSQRQPSCSRHRRGETSAAVRRHAKRRTASAVEHARKHEARSVPPPALTRHHVTFGPLRGGSSAGASLSFSAAILLADRSLHPSIQTRSGFPCPRRAGSPLTGISRWSLTQGLAP
jgi:hypothetical protein